MKPPRGVGPIALMTSDAVLHTVSQPGHLTQLIVVNTASAARQVTIAVVPRGASLEPLHHVYSDLIVSPNDFVSWSGVLPVGIGDTIHGEASNSGVNFRATLQESR